MIATAAESWKHLYIRKTTFAIQSRFPVFHTNPCNFEIFKTFVIPFLTQLRARIVCYELKGDLSPVMLKEIFHDSFENFEITRICVENHAGVTGWQKLCFSYKCFQLLVAVVIASFEICG